MLFSVFLTIPNISGWRNITCGSRLLFWKPLLWVAHSFSFNVICFASKNVQCLATASEHSPQHLLGLNRYDQSPLAFPQLQKSNMYWPSQPDQYMSMHCIHYKGSWRTNHTPEWQAELSNIQGIGSVATHMKNGGKSWSEAVFQMSNFQFLIRSDIFTHNQLFVAFKRQKVLHSVLSTILENHFKGLKKLR